MVILETIKEFSKREIIPYMSEWDEKQIFPLELFKKIGELGMMGVLVPEEYGGAGFSYDEYVTIISEISLDFRLTNRLFECIIILTLTNKSAKEAS